MGNKKGRDPKEPTVAGAQRVLSIIEGFENSTGQKGNHNRPRYRAIPMAALDEGILKRGELLGPLFSWKREDLTALYAGEAAPRSGRASLTSTIRKRCEEVIAASAPKAMA